MSFDETFVFSNDSIYGIGNLENGKRVDSVFVNRKPTAAESEEISKSLATMNLDSLQFGPKEEMGVGVYYAFSINYGEKKMNMNLHHQTNSDLVQLCTKLNALLPKKNAIRYQ